MRPIKKIPTFFHEFKGIPITVVDPTTYRLVDFPKQALLFPVNFGPVGAVPLIFRANLGQLREEERSRAA